MRHCVVHVRVRVCRNDVNGIWLWYAILIQIIQFCVCFGPVCMINCCKRWQCAYKTIAHKMHTRADKRAFKNSNRTKYSTGLLTVRQISSYESSSYYDLDHFVSEFQGPTKNWTHAIKHMTHNGIRGTFYGRRTTMYFFQFWIFFWFYFIEMHSIQFDWQWHAQFQGRKFGKVGLSPVLILSFSTEIEQFHRMNDCGFSNSRFSPFSCTLDSIEFYGSIIVWTLETSLFIFWTKTFSWLLENISNRT